MGLSSIGNMSVRIVRAGFDPRSLRTSIMRLSALSRSWPSGEHMLVLAYGAISVAIGLSGYFWLDLRIGEAAACTLALCTIASLAHISSRLANALRSLAAHLDAKEVIGASGQLAPDRNATPATDGLIRSEE